MARVAFLLSIVVAGIPMFSVRAEQAADRRPTKIWNRTGPLGETPKHVTDAYPLSDQQNEGGWVKFEPMSDEFEGDKLDHDQMDGRHVLVEGPTARIVQRKERNRLGRQAASDHAKGEGARESSRSSATRTTRVPHCTPRLDPAMATTRSKPSR